MGERLAAGNVGLALLANTVATGAGFVALILTFGPISGAHFNPVVAAAATGLFRWLVPTLPRVAPAVVAGKMGSESRETRGAGMTTVLFACTHNAGRSQMAAAFFNGLAESTKARAISAGTEPAVRIHSEVATAMREVGIDLGAATPRRLTPELAGSAQWLVTMGCDEACPVVPGVRREDWKIEDPKGQPLERVRAIRDEVRRRVEGLIAVQKWGADRRG